MGEHKGTDGFPMGIGDVKLADDIEQVIFMAPR